MSKELVSEIIIPKQDLTFKTEDGKVIFKITATRDGGALSFFNNKEKLVAKISASEYGGGLGIYDDRGMLIWPKP